MPREEHSGGFYKEGSRAVGHPVNIAVKDLINAIRADPEAIASIVAIKAKAECSKGHQHRVAVYVVFDGDATEAFDNLSKLMIGKM